jgi:hypothetical protein
MAGLLIEYYYRCGCHGHSPKCNIHEASSYAEASARSTKKKYKRKKNSLTGSLKPSLGFFPDLLVFNHFKSTLPDYDFLEKYIAKANHMVVLTDSPKELIDKFDYFNYEVIDAIVYAGQFDIKEKTLSQIVFSRKPIENSPTLCYIGNSSLLEAYWLKCLKPKSLGVVNATTWNWFVAAVQQKVRHTIHTPFFLLEKRIVNTRFQELINTPEERYNGNI